MAKKRMKKVHAKDVLEFFIYFMVEQPLLHFLIGRAILLLGSLAGSGSRLVDDFPCVVRVIIVISSDVVFAESLPVMRSVMDGFNGYIFAYGQNGTAKPSLWKVFRIIEVLIIGLLNNCSVSSRREAHQLYTHFM